MRAASLELCSDRPRGCKDLFQAFVALWFKFKSLGPKGGAESFSTDAKIMEGNKSVKVLSMTTEVTIVMVIKMAIESY